MVFYFSGLIQFRSIPAPAGHSPFNYISLWDVHPVAQIPVNPEDARVTAVAVPGVVTG